MTDKVVTLKGKPMESSCMTEDDMAPLRQMVTEAEDGRMESYMIAYVTHDGRVSTFRIKAGCSITMLLGTAQAALFELNTVVYEDHLKGD